VLGGLAGGVHDKSHRDTMGIVRLPNVGERAGGRPPTAPGGRGLLAGKSGFGRLASVGRPDEVAVDLWPRTRSANTRSGVTWSGAVGCESGRSLAWADLSRASFDEVRGREGSLR
jgi:hypothetical protein